MPYASVSTMRPAATLSANSRTSILPMRKRASWSVSTGISARSSRRGPHTPAKSLRSGNKAGHAGPHHRVEPDVRRDALPHLPHGVFRQGRYLKVLLDVARFG